MEGSRQFSKVNTFLSLELGRTAVGEEEIAFWQIMSLQQGKYWY